MTALGELLEAPELRPALRHVTGPIADRAAASVVLVEELDQLGYAPTGALAILTEGASRAASGYHLDMALRLAGSRGAVAVVLTDGREAVPSTAATIADRAELAVLVAPPGTDLAALLLGVQRELAGGAETALTRLAGVLSALRHAEEGEEGAERVLEAAREAFGLALEQRPPQDDDIVIPLVVDGETEATLCVPRQGGHVDTVAEAVARLAAAGVARAEATARQAAEVPVRSRGELLTEFLSAGPDRADRLLQRLRAAGLAIDAWHAVVRIEVEGPGAVTDGDEVASFQLRQRLGLVALEAAQAVGGTWHRAQVGSALLLIRMERRDPRGRGGPELTRLVGEILSRITARVRDVPLVCGVGSVHPGAAGLRASAAEAHAAVAAARAAGRRNVPVSFDGVGLKRALIEWYASDTGKEMVDALLEPLDRLGPPKRESAIRTLQAFLDNQGSLARTAEQLHLHRNTVDYRIQRIVSALDVDPNDPDTRLMLQLACRARMLG